METADKRFTKQEEALLRRAKGAELLSIDAVLAAPPDNSWNTVRLHFGDFDIDVDNRLGNITVDEFGSIEEFGLLSVEETDKNILDIPEVGVDTTVFQIGEVVNGVSVINDIAEIYEGGNLVARIEYPQAIALNTGAGTILLDKEVWFSELIVVKRGSCAEDLLYDDSVNWEDSPDEDPSTHFEFHVEKVELED